MSGRARTFFRWGPHAGGPKVRNFFHMCKFICIFVSFCPSGFVHFAMEKCLDLALRTEGAAGSVAPTQTPSGAFICISVMFCVCLLTRGVGCLPPLTFLLAVYVEFRLLMRDYIPRSMSIPRHAMPVYVVYCYGILCRFFSFYLLRFLQPGPFFILFLTQKESQ